MRIKHLFLSQSVILFSLLATPSETLVAQTLPQPTREALTSSLTKYVFYNWLINNILYLCVT